MLTEATYNSERNKRDDYFSSLENRFLRYLKNKETSIFIYSITTIVFLIAFLLTVFFSVEILGVIYSIIGLNKYHLPPNNELDFDLVSSAIWLILALFEYLIYKVGFKLLNKFFANNYNKKDIPLKTRLFCYICLTIKELDFYFLEKGENNLRKAAFYFDSFLLENENNLKLNVDKKEVDVSISSIVLKFVSNVDWLNLSQESMEILSAYENLEVKILNRIKKNRDLEKVRFLLSELSLSLFAKTHYYKQGNHPESMSIYSEISKDQLLSFSKGVNRLTFLDMDTSKIKTKWFNRLKNISYLNYFEHSNPLILFIFWLLTISVILLILVFLGLNWFELKVDSNILIGYFSIVVAGAIGITGIIWKKKDI